MIQLDIQHSTLSLPRIPDIVEMNILTAIQELSEDVRDLTIGHGRSNVDTLDAVPEPMAFYREYVAQNRPCLIKGGCADWPEEREKIVKNSDELTTVMSFGCYSDGKASCIIDRHKALLRQAVSTWNLEYLSDKLGNAQITVDFTPTGYGDAIAFNPATNKETFVLPEERKMTFGEFHRELTKSWDDRSIGVPYVQHQNDSLREEYPDLIKDAAPDISWATEALGHRPEAINLWVGDKRAVTSFHKDHYENFYAVIAGCKSFLLLPPVDCHRMYLRKYPVGRYVKNQSCFDIAIEDSDEKVIWSAVDPLSESCALSCPRFYEGPEPLKANVQEGDILYLPSMYYHHVSQSGGAHNPTIAVNYWYNMVFDIKYAYFCLLEKLTSSVP